MQYATNFVTVYLLSLSLVGVPTSFAQRPVAPELEIVSKSVENYFRRKRPGWKLNNVPPATPPGSQASPDMVVHFWSSEKCFTAEVIIDGVRSGNYPVSCHFKLAISKGLSASDALARLNEFVLNEASATAVSVGDKGYIWRGTELVFVRGKFTFWFGGSVKLRVGDFTNNREFLEKLAREIADSITSAPEVKATPE